MTKRSLLFPTLLLLAIASPGADPGEMAAAKALLSQFLAPGADVEKLTRQLMPGPADYQAVFTPAVATKMQAHYARLWTGRVAIKPNPGQTELRVWSATGADLKTGSGDASQFPGGYQKVAPHLNPGRTFYRWKFVKPGESLGMAYDGLVRINGQWRWFPKPWSAVE